MRITIFAFAAVATLGLYLWQSTEPGQSLNTLDQQILESSSELNIREAIARTPAEDAYSNYSLSTLVDLAETDSKAAFELAKRIYQQDPDAALRWIVQSSVLEGGTAAPFRWWAKTLYGLGTSEKAIDLDQAKRRYVFADILMMLEGDMEEFVEVGEELRSFGHRNYDESYLLEQSREILSQLPNAYIDEDGGMSIGPPGGYTPEQISAAQEMYDWMAKSGVEPYLPESMGIAPKQRNTSYMSYDEATLRSLAESDLHAEIELLTRLRNESRGEEAQPYLERSFLRGSAVSLMLIASNHGSSTEQAIREKVPDDVIKEKMIETLAWVRVAETMLLDGKRLKESYKRFEKHYDRSEFDSLSKAADVRAIEIEKHLDDRRQQLGIPELIIDIPEGWLASLEFEGDSE